MSKSIATAIVLVALSASGLGEARAALPPAPFALSAWPSTTREGGDLTLQLLGHDGAPPADISFDLYVAVIQDGKFFGAYLTDREAWSPKPEPYRRGVSLAQVDGLTLRFRRVNPTGWFTFRVYFVNTSGVALSRKHYVLQPVDVTVRIDPADGRGPGTLSVLSVGVLMVAAWTIVLRYPRRRPSPPAMPSATGKRSAV